MRSRIKRRGSSTREGIVAQIAHSWSDNLNSVHYRDIQFLLGEMQVNTDARRYNRRDSNASDASPSLSRPWCLLLQIVVTAEWGSVPIPLNSSLFSLHLKTAGGRPSLIPLAIQKWAGCCFRAGLPFLFSFFFSFFSCVRERCEVSTMLRSLSRPGVRMCWSFWAVT